MFFWVSDSTLHHINGKFSWTSKFLFIKILDNWESSQQEPFPGSCLGGIRTVIDYDRRTVKILLALTHLHGNVPLLLLPYKDVSRL